MPGGSDEQYYYDYDGNGYLDDAERDEDADGLTNYDETHRLHDPRATGRAVQRRDAVLRSHYAGTDLDDPDTDGDGVRDGADDQDHDDVPNIMECSRTMAVQRSPARPPDGNDRAAPARPSEGLRQPVQPVPPAPQVAHLQAVRHRRATTPRVDAVQRDRAPRKYYLIKN